MRYVGLSVVDASGRHLRAALALIGQRLLVRVWDRGARYPLQFDPFLQQGPKLTGSGETGYGWFGWSVALSADGDTALIGGPLDDPGENGSAGAAWVFTRSGSTWTQQGSKLTPTGLTTNQGPFGTVEDDFGYSVALSADGDTALIGGPYTIDFVGAAWVFTRSGSTWTEQGPMLGPGSVPADVASDFGYSVALSGDGNTALISDPGLDGVWIFTRSRSTWAEQGPVLTGSDEIGTSGFGDSVALSSDGETALIGGPDDNGDGGRAAVGAAWVFTHVPSEASRRSGRAWTQQGPKLTGRGEIGKYGEFGSSVALSANGNTALIGGRGDNDVGAAWVFTRSGIRSGPTTWAQQGPKLTGSGAVSDSNFGNSVALSADGNTALIGGPGYNLASVGAAWLFARSGSTWAQRAADGPGGSPSRSFLVKPVAEFVDPSGKVQYRATNSRCQRSKVARVTRNTAQRMRGSSLASVARRARSVAEWRGRATCRRRTKSW